LERSIFLKYRTHNSHFFSLVGFQAAADYYYSPLPQKKPCSIQTTPCCMTCPWHGNFSSKSTAQRTCSRPRSPPSVLHTEPSGHAQQACLTGARRSESRKIARLGIYGVEAYTIFKVHHDYTPSSLCPVAECFFLLVHRSEKFWAGETSLVMTCIRLLLARSFVNKLLDHHAAQPKFDILYIRKSMRRGLALTRVENTYASIRLMIKRATNKVCKQRWLIPDLFAPIVPR